MRTLVMKLQDIPGFKTIALASLTVIVLGMLFGKADLDKLLLTAWHSIPVI